MTLTGMNHRLIIKTLGALLGLLGITMMIPLGVALYYRDGAAGSFMIAALCTLSISAGMYFYARDASPPLPTKGAFFVVTATWVLGTVFGSLPYYISGSYPTLIDAWFESASGFTTTGASVLGDVESLPPSILLWRSLTQFLGGMGIVVLSLAVLPLLGVGGMDLYRAEAPGPTTDKLTARVSETARALWIVYLLFAAVETVLLYFCGMDPFDAVNHALTTMATGGFSTKNASIAGFDNAAIESVITLFMFFAGVNFLLHYRLIVRREFAQFANREFHFYLSIVVAATLMLTAVTWGVQYESIGPALRYTSFQVVSLLSTTGYATADYLEWGYFAQTLLLALMVIGGSAGSTAGGLKCIRALILFRQGKRELYRLIHRKAVLPLKVGRKSIPVHVSSAIIGFFFLYMFILLIAGLLLTACGIDIITSFSAVVSALSNIGPALGDVGPTSNYGALPQEAKLILSSCMIIGRLEILTVLVLFTREFWSS